MKKVTKKLLSILLAMMLVLTLNVSVAFAESEIDVSSPIPRQSLGDSSLKEVPDSSPSTLGDSSLKEVPDPSLPTLGDSHVTPEPDTHENPEEVTLGLSAFSSYGVPVVVSDFAGLETAIGAKAPHIILSADIVMLKNLNITSNVIIDGEGHSISEGAKYSFRIHQNDISIEIKNTYITGFFFYGFVNTEGSSYGNNATVTYNNVDYDGPQLAHLAKNNTLRLIDSRIILANKSGSDPAQELGEVAYIEIGGTTLVHKKDGVEGFIWFKGSGTNLGKLTILDNAQVTLRNDKTYFNYNEVSLGVDLEVGENAQLEILMQEGMNADTGHILRNFVVKKGAKVRLESFTAIRPLSIKDNLTIGEGAEFYVSNAASATTNVLYLTSTGTTVTMDNPKIVYIKGRSGNYYSPNVSMKANVFNTFYTTTPDQGGYPSNATGGNNGIANGHSSAYPEDFVTVSSKTDPMNYFNSNSNNGFVVGQFDMNTVLPVAPSPYDTDVTLTMTPQSEGKMTFIPRDETVPKNVSGVVDGTGVLVLKSEIPLNGAGLGPFVAGEEIQLVLREKVESTTGFLHVHRAITVVEKGGLSIVSVPVLDFGVKEIPGISTTYPLAQDALLTIKDDHSTPVNWQVRLKASQFTQEGGSKTLDENALGMLDNGVFRGLKNAEVIWEGSTNLTQPLQNKTWGKEGSGGRTCTATGSFACINGFLSGYFNMDSGDCRLK